MLVFTNMYPFTFLTSYMSERSVSGGIWYIVTEIVTVSSVCEEFFVVRHESSKTGCSEVTYMCSGTEVSRLFSFAHFDFD